MNRKLEKWLTHGIEVFLLAFLAGLALGAGFAFGAQLLKMLLQW